ncbi:pyrimidine reductase family protein [Specibacter cremeus]|uniref:pyrimidine reductase family protein n=1 Tax=Specibacter cremeus TaxID=1629051 RepID=UPI000F7B62FA|nr:pyrimidine reductase family protein [Specibacter cremeus]
MSGIDRVFPPPVVEAGDADLLEWYAAGRRPGPWVGFNFIASLDGAATLGGRSGGLGNAADQRVFGLLRRHADVIVVGAGTVRAEGYGGPLLPAEARAWRTSRGLPAHPPLAIVSGTLNLDPGMPVFTQAPVRPLVITTAAAAPGRVAALAPVADVVTAGAATIDIGVLIAELGARGLARIHAEGGPSLLGSFQAAGRVDELCLTLSPVLVGGNAPRIAAGPPGAAPESMELAHILRAGSMLFLRYVRG